jgi:hypothetical protein
MASNVARALGLSLVLGVLSTGCAGTRGPEPLPLDRVNCARCGMLISSAANAAEALVPGGETHFYDDVGCLATDPAAMKAGALRFVQVAGGAGWASTDVAWFASSATASTPMGYGFLAFSTESAARAADRDGRPRRWTEVVQAAGER